MGSDAHMPILAHTRGCHARAPDTIVETSTTRLRYPDISPGCLLTGFPYLEAAPMAKTDIAALLAMGAAFFVGLNNVIHQRSAHEVTDEEVGIVGLFTLLLRDRQWWLGTIGGALGFALQAAALDFGSVVEVQTILCTALLFALPINGKIYHRRVTRWECTGAALLAAGIAVIVTVGNPQPGRSHWSLETWLKVGAVMVLVRILGGVGARMWPGTPRAVLLAVVAGSLWGLVAVLTKGVTEILGHGLSALLRAPALYWWAGIAVAAMALQQSSFRAGSLTASMPTMFVTQPVVGSVLGIVVLGETIHTSALRVASPGARGLVTILMSF
jgi:drug/metabolite transporter (DMT)-like permease